MFRRGLIVRVGDVSIVMVTSSDFLAWVSRYLGIVWWGVMLDSWRHRSDWVHVSMRGTLVGWVGIRDFISGNGFWLWFICGCLVFVT
jgi:hypothetical protein